MLNNENERIKFLTTISNLIDYWDTDGVGEDQRDKLEGLAFSILSHMDGCSGEPYALVPCDENNGSTFSLKDDIAGCLHEMFYEVHREVSRK